MKLPPLIAVRYPGYLWVAFGNRRLKSLKEYSANFPEPGEIRVRVIVHDTSVDDRLRLFAKLILATPVEQPSSAAAPCRQRNRCLWSSTASWNDIGDPNGPIAWHSNNDQG